MAEGQLVKLSPSLWALMYGSTTIATIDMVNNVVKLTGDLQSLSVNSTISGTELSFLDGALAGTAVASKAAVLGTYGELDTLSLATLKLGANAGTTVTKTAAQINALAVGVAGGYKVARGSYTMLSASDTVATGLTTVVSVVVSLQSDPTLTCDRVTADVGDQTSAPIAGSVYIKAWMPTGAALATPIAATGYANMKVHWIAVGT